MTNLPITGVFKVTCEYNKKGNLWSSGYHKGIDLVCDNRSIYSTCDGVVKTVGFDKDGWGQYIRVQENSTKNIHIFCHLITGSQKVKVGQKVTRATILGTMGTTGKSTGVHLHFQIEKSNTDRTVLDPTNWLRIPNKVGSYDTKNYSVFKDHEKIASWALDAVYALKAAKIVNGDDKEKFNPTSNITRQEMAVLVNSLCNVKEYSFKSHNDATKFVDDAKIAEWAKSAVYSLKKKKLMNGDDKGKFNPTSAITRQEAAVLVNNIFAKTLGGVSAKYVDDAKISTWARAAVYNLKRATIMSGDDKNKFNPTGKLTRQEAAVLMYNLTKIK